jgi:hypothetical protein
MGYGGLGYGGCADIIGATNTSMLISVVVFTPVSHRGFFILDPLFVSQSASSACHSIPPFQSH